MSKTITLNEATMQRFDELLDVVGHLMGPEGCPWDQKQTFESLRSSVLEEVYELIDAINEKDDSKIADELGDLYLNAVFFSKLGEKEGKFNTDSVLQNITDKLVRRHPHVFGDGKKLESADEVEDQWREIKSREKEHAHRKSALDGIPKEIPLLARAQKVTKRLKKAGYVRDLTREVPEFENEEELGELLLGVVVQARATGLDAEMSLRKVLNREEGKFREWEESNSV
jgi:tetrapyrrole methylase family protein/MazG family protein